MQFWCRAKGELDTLVFTSRLRNRYPAPRFRFAAGDPVVNDSGSKFDTEIIRGGQLLISLRSNPEVNLVGGNLRDLLGKFPSNVFAARGTGGVIVINQNNFLSSLNRMVDLLDVSSIKVEVTLNFRITVSLKSENSIGRFTGSRVGSHFVTFLNNSIVSGIDIGLDVSFLVRDVFF